MTIPVRSEDMDLGLTFNDFQEHIIPVCLPGLRQHFVGQYAFVVGWGRTEHGVAQTPSLLQVSASSLPQAASCQNFKMRIIYLMVLISLQEVKVQVISAEKCQSWFKQAHR